MIAVYPNTHIPDHQVAYAHSTHTAYGVFTILYDARGNSLGITDSYPPVRRRRTAKPTVVSAAPGFFIAARLDDDLAGCFISPIISWSICEHDSPLPISIAGPPPDDADWCVAIADGCGSLIVPGIGSVEDWLDTFDEHPEPAEQAIELGSNVIPFRRIKDLTKTL